MTRARTHHEAEAEGEEPQLSEPSGSRRLMTMHETRPPLDRAILIQPSTSRLHEEELALRLEELTHLATSAGLEPVSRQTMNVGHVHPATYLGKGKVEELALLVEEQEAVVVLFNESLSPVQQRNLERTLKAKVVDRTGLILEIFAARARTREGRLQVALASLLYQQSRLVRSWTHLERQRGGFGLRGGPGERQLELDRRLIKEQIVKLKKELTEVERTRALHRQTRRDVPYYAVALVGYTNAGKSTLFNQLAGASVVAADKLFATLDPTMRGLNLPGGGHAILSDTVGFVRDLPHQLVAAFRATLEEVHEADLLIHVIDLSDPAWESQSAAVQKVLEELEAQHKPMLHFYNKCDRIPPESGLPERVRQRPDALTGSALAGEGMEALLHAVEERMGREWPIFTLRLPVTEGKLLARLHHEGRILEQREEEETLWVQVSLPVTVAGRMRENLKKFSSAT